MQSRSSFVLKWSPKFSTTQTLTSHFVAHSFYFLYIASTRGAEEKIWFCYDECWLDFIFPRKTLKTSRKLELSYTHELPSVCFWRISSSAYHLAFRERRTRERRKVDFLVCKYNCQRTTALPKSGKMCDFTPNLFQDEVRNLGQTTHNVSFFLVPFLSRAHKALARKFRYFTKNLGWSDSKMLQNITESVILPNPRARERLLLARFPIKILLRLLRERRKCERRKLGFLIFF